MNGARFTRRACIHAAAAMLVGPSWAGTGGAQRVAALASAWDDAEGRHHIGVLEVVQGGASEALRLRVRHQLQVPTRAHAVVPAADGTLVAVARRPGAWLLRWRPGSPASAARWRWSEADRSFNGHVVPHGSRALMSTESDATDGAGLLVRRDASTLAVLEEWPTGGVDPHAVLALPVGGWLVANGGVPTLPESGRVKGDLSSMDSSVVHLDAQGRQRGIWRLADKRLSLRHLARHAGGLVGVALQAEHDDPDERRRAPLIALWDGQRLCPGDAPVLGGYAGDIAARPSGFLVGATRAGCVARFDLHGRLVARHPLTQACALAPLGVEGWLAGGSAAGLLVAEAGAARAAGSRRLRLDNHWLLLDDAVRSQSGPGGLHA
jgi:hypothetical protein